MNKVLPAKIQKFSVQKSQRVSTEQNKLAIVDMIITFESMGKKGIIVLEVDEDQHSSYNNNTEYERSKYVINKFMGDAYTSRINDTLKTPFKMLFMRFSPTGEYLLGKETGGTIPGIAYSIPERVMILRQWVFWFCMELENVRDFTIMYMFHNQHLAARKKKYGYKYEGTYFVDCAPVSPYGENAWTYCYDPGEILCVRTGKNEDGEPRYDKVVSIARHLDVITPNWRKTNQQLKTPEIEEYLKYNFSQLDIL
jgi:hypothetical protein